MSYLFYGGIFLSPTEVETVRAAAYKYYHLDPVYHEGKLPRVMLMTRAKVAGNLPGRKIANQNELSLFLRQSKQWLYSEGAMELLTPEEQAATMLNTDVLIGVLGSGFANVIYMLPGSVAISFSPPFVGRLLLQHDGGVLPDPVPAGVQLQHRPAERVHGAAGNVRER